MRSSVLEGPIIMGMSGGSWGHPADTPVYTGQPLWKRYWYNNYTRRPLPSQPLSSPTGVSVQYWAHNRGIWSDSFGNRSAALYPASPVVPPSEYASSVSDEAIYKMLSKLKGETWNLSVFMAELPKTMKFASEVLSALWKSYRAVRRGDLRALWRMWFPRYKRGPYRGRHAQRMTDSYWNVVGKPVASSVADKWLAWRYAVSPMVYDLDDALREVHGRGQVSLPIKTASGRANGVYSTSTVSNGLSSSGSVSFSYRACAFYTANPTTAAMTRLGLINLGAMLWEVTPFSFVVDWVIPVGRFIGALDACAAANIVGKTLGYRSTSVATVSGSTKTWTQSADTREDKNYSRVTNYALSPPIPRFRPNLNLMRQADALSLAFGLLTGRGSSPNLKL